jgi:signal transduction histidine kinase
VRHLIAGVQRRLWMDACQPEASHPDDIIRFNEAIDQALAESVSFFSSQVDQARDLLLGMLGHDMRSPLQAIQMTVVYLAKDACPQCAVLRGKLVNSNPLRARK